jgi:bifunctional ADP-heptose synthase (sugar kinase/adenylyltransferase)
MSQHKLPPRLPNSALARARTVVNEVEWLRPSDLANHNLPRPIILTNGAFDLAHVGHRRLFAMARKQAGKRGTVICALDSDQKVALAKAGRPILSWIERAALLNYEPIDFIVEIDSSVDMDSLMTNLKPDLRVQGYSYLSTQTRYPNIPKLYVRDAGMHTSDIIQRILDKYAQTQAPANPSNRNQEAG